MRSLIAIVAATYYVFILVPALGMPLDAPATVVHGRPSGNGWFNLIPANLAGWKAEPAYWKVNQGVLEGYTPGTPEHQSPFAR